MSASLCSTLLILGVFVFVSAEQKSITAQSGQDVTLPCRAPNNNIIIGVEWNRADLETQYVLFYRDNLFDPDEQYPSFKDRVGLQDRQMKDGDVSLILKNVTINDAGTYECRVKTEKKRRENQSIVIKEPILNENAFSSITLIVVPPGQPGGDNKDEGGRKEDGSVGLIVGLSVSALLLVAAAAVGFLIYRKHKQQSQDPL
ncbi:coxsackievirus and adenovirus receptor [Haplochromis burtoni]|uniref:coxsackievirus and adenovirus receptor n=1 Tax=Haplochromis burtoni TaxID=8153 RepID=UPI0003BDBEB0|nr:coxsackievirus and adenovirus receptor [Haplochromis burtoni]